MEDKTRTNWSAVHYYLDGVLHCFEDENPTVRAVHNMICTLMDLVNSFM